MRILPLKKDDIVRQGIIGVGGLGHLAIQVIKTMNFVLNMTCFVLNSVHILY